MQIGIKKIAALYAIRTSAPVSLRLNGQLISVAEESVFCLGDFILPFNGTATTHQEDE
ncbi:hypothetical protein Q459_24655 [Escherichia coli ATCC BAA-2215]|nr:hypothetical protein Q459_24655 [Escherichia coli ATCC BAA-2215]